MGKARHNYPSFILPEPDYIPDYLLDMVSYGMKLGAVPQENGMWPPYAMVDVPRRIKRQPQLLTRRGIKFDFLDYHEKPLGKEWCSWCGEWLDWEKFGKDKRNTRRHECKSHCLKCVAKQERIRYYNKQFAAAA